MRLVHVKHLQVEEITTKVIPPYAILSHTWGDDEVTLRDMQNGGAKGKGGFEKIVRSCQIAEADGFDYIWVDTCCIDKLSSAELSEAINSMFRWYREADVCYVHLSDVSSRDDPFAYNSAFANSRWFTRGWTLQELIAPCDLIIYDQDWQEIGTRFTLRETISRITGIHMQALGGNFEALHEYSIAQRMSWASRRQTTRPEDLAYSLLGLFSVNMPMLYGEGEQAFIRLQDEIMKRTDDPTIFAWRGHQDRAGMLLARSPLLFAASRNIVRSKESEDHAMTFSVTNQGVYLDMYVKLMDKMTFQGDSTPHLTTLAMLDCYELGREPSHRVGIFVVKSETSMPGTYIRAGSDVLEFISNHQAAAPSGSRRRDFRRKRFYGVIDYEQPCHPKYPSQCHISTKPAHPNSPQVLVLEALPAVHIVTEEGLFFPIGHRCRLSRTTIAAVKFALPNKQPWVVVVMSTSSGTILTNTIVPKKDERLEKTVMSYAKSASSRDEESDRKSLKLLDRLEPVTVLMKRQIFAGGRVLGIHVEY